MWTVELGASFSDAIAKRIAGALQPSQVFAIPALRIEFSREADGRFIAEVPELPGTLAYGKTEEEARRAATALALEVIADRVANGEAAPIVFSTFSIA